MASIAIGLAFPFGFLHVRREARFDALGQKRYDFCEVAGTYPSGGSGYRIDHPAARAEVTRHRRMGVHLFGFQPRAC